MNLTSKSLAVAGIAIIFLIAGCEQQQRSASDQSVDDQVAQSDVSKPESDLPESDLPESDLPESDLPESDLPESDLPGSRGVDPNTIQENKNNGAAGNDGGAEPEKVAGKAELLEAPFSPEEIARSRSAWAKSLGVEETFTNEHGMKFVLIPPGKFKMGSPEGEEGRKVHETLHPVTLTKAYFMATTETTQKVYEEITGETPWEGEDYVEERDNNPAVYVNWGDVVQKVLKKLNAEADQDGVLLEGWEYALPSEAQWEYACRGGTTTRFCFGDDDRELGEYAWYDKNAWDVGKKHAQAVGELKANQFGLYDMHGNVGEWTADEYAEYPAEGVTNPLVDNSGFNHVSRGRSFLFSSSYCRSAYRSVNLSGRNSNQGFRLVLVQVSHDEINKAELLEAPFSPEEISRSRSALAKSLGVEETFTDYHGMKFVLIPPGKFKMGSPEDEEDREPINIDETLHDVTLTKAYFMATTETTQKVYTKITGEVPWKDKPYVKESDNHPAVYVSWDDVVEKALKKLNAEADQDAALPEGWKYGLPSEAQWEYACRGGTTTRFCFGDDDRELDEYAWYEKNAWDVGERYLFMK